MKVHMRYFAALKEETGMEKEELELIEGSGMMELFRALRKAHPLLRDLDGLLFAVNGVRSSLDAKLKEGDLVGLIPPVSGG